MREVGAVWMVEADFASRGICLIELFLGEFEAFAGAVQFGGEPLFRGGPLRALISPILWVHVASA